MGCHRLGSCNALEKVCVLRVGGGDQGFFCVPYFLSSVPALATSRPHQREAKTWPSPLPRPLCHLQMRPGCWEGLAQQGAQLVDPTRITSAAPSPSAFLLPTSSSLPPLLPSKHLQVCGYTSPPGMPFPPFQFPPFDLLGDLQDPTGMENAM